MADEKSKRGRGRPPKNATERRRHIQTFRCTDALRDAIQKQAEANQRSISEEVEYRLQLGVAAEERLEADRRDPNFGVTQELLSRIQKGMSLLQGYVGNDWPNDVAANVAMFYVVLALSDDYFKPKHSDDWSKLERDAIERSLEAAEKVVDVVTWRKTAPTANNLLDLASFARLSAQEVFALRKKFVARLEEQERERKRESSK